MNAETDSELNQWLEMLRSPDLSDRLVAVKNLQYLGDEEATNALLIALSDDSIPFRKLQYLLFGKLATLSLFPL